jgi:hypothetical protein
VNNKVNVLIFPAGSEIAHEIHASLRYNLHVELFGASGKSDNARLIYDKNHYFEDDFYVTQPNFLEKFNELLEENKIGIVMPTHDTIALYCAEHQDEIKAKVLTSPYKTALIAREKRLIYELFQDTGLTPIVYEEPFNNVDYPVFLKPNIGEGAKRTVICENADEIFRNIEKNPDLLVCEYLPGEELSVDCFTNKNGELLFIGPRTRDRVQMGISFHSVSVPVTKEIRHIAKTINERTKIRGAWFFQVKKDREDKYKLLEFAVRQASTMGLYRQVGVNFALLSIFDAMDLDVKILQNEYPIELERSLYNRYKHDIDYNTVYIDFDDCVVVNSAVNETAVRYLYFCKRKNKKVVLLTKHKDDIYKTLNEYRIHNGLFDEIISISDDDNKAKYIQDKKSIFIDNYFFDRANVKGECGVPVFDVDAIESLIEES